jgi:multidrug transporter EmrE-like cation transporter
MTPSTIGLIAASVACSSCSQVLLKAAMTRPVIQDAISAGKAMPIALAVLGSQMVIGGLALFGLSALLWLAVLARAPLSTAYPMVAVGMVITVAAGSLLFGEPMSPAKIAGVSLIVGGVVLIGL